ncbi:MAG: alpha-galactosidase [Phycisphaerae bacterium]|nr:alpha-galactosidase [Phycisphaerae bacterium]
MNCHAELAGNTLIIENDLIRREFAWNGGLPATRLILDKRTGARWEMPGTSPDCTFPGEPGVPEAGEFHAAEMPATAISPAHLAAEVFCRLGGLEVRRVFRIYPGCPAIASDCYLRGRATRSWRDERVDEQAWRDVGLAKAFRTKPPPIPVAERIVLGGRHTVARAVEFHDVTDYCNNLVESRSAMLSRWPVALRGNLLLAIDGLSRGGFFVLREAPCSDRQLAWPGADFVADRWEVTVLGLGVLPEDLDKREWVRCYSTVLGVGGATEQSLLSAVREYQHARRAARPGRDHMLMLNTWGDRGCYDRIGEAFALAEIDGAARLGLTHFQLDDGWQHGNFCMPNLPEVPRVGDYWAVHVDRFPRGLLPVVERARERGVELCLWFCPEAADSYAAWEDNARTLIALWRQFGIRTFKIDGVHVPDKRAEANLRAFLDAVLAGTNGEAFFNLDVTAGQRFGYHCFTEYGNLFVENRYTEWSNYFPHWALRNLWQLAHYVPPQLLQIEFLNKWRNQANYDAADPIAPANVPFDYCFAVTMMAQPLGWFEAGNLPGEAFDLAPLVAVYRCHQARIHAGRIFPIGREPSGGAWTGFQSVREDGGYVAVYREFNGRDRAKLRLWSPPTGRTEFRLVAGAGADFGATPDADGRVEFALPSPLSFALYEYAAQ